jgi:hypothetical protein
MSGVEIDGLSLHDMTALCVRRYDALTDGERRLVQPLLRGNQRITTGQQLSLAQLKRRLLALPEPAG